MRLEVSIRKENQERGYGGAVVWTWLLNWKWKGGNHVAKRGRAFQKEEAGCIKALGNKLLIHPASLGFPLIHLANHCCNIFQIAHCTALISLLIKKMLMVLINIRMNSALLNLALGVPTPPLSTWTVFFISHLKAPDIFPSLHHCSHQFPAL